MLTPHLEDVRVAFNSMLMNWPNQEFSLLVKRTRMERETMTTPGLVSLANQLSHTPDESSQRKTAKIHNLQLQQMKAPKQNQNLPICCCYYCKEPGHWKRNCYKFKPSGTCSPLTSLSNVLSNVLPILKDGAL